MQYIKKIIVLILLVGSTVGALVTVNIIPSEEPTVEKILPRQLVHQLRVQTESDPASQEILLVLITHGNTPPGTDIIQTNHKELEKLEEIKWVWSSLNRPVLKYDGTALFTIIAENSDYLGATSLNQLFTPNENSALILAGFDNNMNTLSNAQLFSKKIASIGATLDTSGYKISAISSPIIRSASWHQAENDLSNIWPYLLIAITLIPILLFRSLTALIFPLILASLTLIITLFLHQVISGPINPLMFILIPFLWSIATLDGLHLYHRITKYRKLDFNDAIKKSKQELYLPCLVTSVTTIAGLIVLYVHGDSEITESVGLWGTIGTAIAYVLTFTLGGFILRTFAIRSSLPAWSSSFVYKIGYYCINNWKMVILVWLCITIFLFGFSFKVQTKHDYPDAFSKNHQITKELNQFYKYTNMDLAYFELNLNHSNASDTQSFYETVVTFNKFLTSLPETKIVVSPLLFIAELFESKIYEKYPVNALLKNLQIYFEANKSAQHNGDILNWLDFEHGKFRYYLFFKPTHNTRIENMFDWIRKFDHNVLKDAKIEFSGPGYLYHAAQFYSTKSVLTGIFTTLVVFIVMFLILFKSKEKVIISCIVFMLPPLLVLGIMGLFQIPWSIGLISIPIILMSLGVDDTVHVMWPYRQSQSTPLKSIAIVSRQSGLPLLTTTVLLCLSFLTLTQSGFQINHEIGILLSIGLALALLANLTLLPALLQAWKNIGKSSQAYANKAVS